MTLGDRVTRAREAIVAAGIRPQDAALDAEVLAWIKQAYEVGEQKHLLEKS